jgi:hypothetical protein
MASGGALASAGQCLSAADPRALTRTLCGMVGWSASAAWALTQGGPRSAPKSQVWQSRCADRHYGVCDMSEHAPPKVPPAGWYPNPQVAGAQRYWDGRMWTDDVASGQSGPMVTSDMSVWVPIGWICAFLFPLAGFVIGFCLSSKYSQQRLWMMAVSVLVGVIFGVTYRR